MLTSSLPIQSLDILVFAIGCIVVGLTLLLAGLVSNNRNGLGNPVVALSLLLLALGIGSPLAWTHFQDQQIQEHDANAARLAQVGAPRLWRDSRSGLTDRGRPVRLRELRAGIDVADWIAAED